MQGCEHRPQNVPKGQFFNKQVKIIDKMQHQINDTHINDDSLLLSLPYSTKL